MCIRDRLGSSSQAITGTNEPLIRDATAEEAARKRKALNEPDHVEEYEMEDSTSAKKQRTAASSDSNSKQTGTDDVVARDKAAAAAAARVEQSRSRGVGSLSTLSELEAEATKQAAKGTRDCFGAEAASKLRKQLAASQSASSSSGQPASTSGCLLYTSPSPRDS